MCRSFGSQRTHKVSLSRHCRTVFQSGCASSHPHKQCKAGFLSPHACWHLLFPVSIIIAILVDVHASNLQFAFGFNLHFHDEQWSWNNFSCFLAIWVSCFVGTYSNILLFLFEWLSFFVFLYWFVESGQPFIVSILLVENFVWFYYSFKNIQFTQHIPTIMSFH